MKKCLFKSDNIAGFSLVVMCLAGDQILAGIEGVSFGCHLAVNSSY